MTGGRIFSQSMKPGAIRHETPKARRAENSAVIVARLTERKDRLARLARDTGWRFHTHHTGDSAASALLWLHGALGRKA